jgi:hypothetical protein
VTDPDARGFAHWIAVDIPAASNGLGEGASGTGVAGREGRNDFGRIGWGGPCPPSGTHRYVFDLFALSAPLGLSGTPSASDVRRALAGRVIAEAPDRHVPSASVVGASAGRPRRPVRRATRVRGV